MKQEYKHMFFCIVLISAFSFAFKKQQQIKENMYIKIDKQMLVKDISKKKYNKDTTTYFFYTPNMKEDAVCFFLTNIEDYEAVDIRKLDAKKVVTPYQLIDSFNIQGDGFIKKYNFYIIPPCTKDTCTAYKAWGIYHFFNYEDDAPD